MGWIWALLTYRHRRIPDNARIHESVRARIAADPAYGKRIPTTVAWDDEDWLIPRPPAT
jgi:hypothetical protein